MAREARKISKSGNYYIVLKGNELFVTEEDKKQFKAILERNFATGIVRGCVIEKEEIRLVVKEGEKGISMTMKPVTTSYARYFNRTHDREGKLFLGRFKSVPLETSEEIEESVKNLKKADSSKKNARKNADKVAADMANKKTAKTAEKETAKNVKEEPVLPKRKDTSRNLPSWLL